MARGALSLYSNCSNAYTERTEVHLSATPASLRVAYRLYLVRAREQHDPTHSIYTDGPLAHPPYHLVPSGPDTHAHKQTQLSIT